MSRQHSEVQESPSQRLLERPRLLQFLQSALSTRSTFLIAPPGYGKTTLVRQLATSPDIPVVWCGLQAEDCSPQAVARRIVYAVEEPLARKAPGGRLSMNAGADPYRDIRRALGNLIASASSYCIAVLEDYHHACNSAETNEMIGKLLEELPSEVHLVVTSRISPPIERLPGMIAQGQVSLLGANDLAFNRDEVAGVIELITGAAPNEDEVRHVFSATKGWPVCVALLAAQGIPYGAAIQADASVYGYFFAEIFRALPFRLAQFMLLSSVLPSLTANRCQRLLPKWNATQFLGQLAQRYLVQPTGDPSGEVYEYHPLVRDFLLSRLRSESNSLFSELHVRAARILSREGRWREGMELLSLVEAWPEAAGLVEKLAPPEMEHGRWDTLCELLDRLPEEVVQERQALVLLRARLAYLRADASTALQILDRSPAVVDTAQGSVIKAAALCLRGEYRDAVKYAQAALHLAGKTGDDRIEGEARLYLGMARAIQGSYRAAERELRKALKYFVQSGNVYGEASACVHLAGICHFAGRADEETVLLEQAEGLWRRLGNSEQLTWTMNNLAVSHHLRGNWEEALRCYSECLRLAQEFGVRKMEAYCLIGMADLLREDMRLPRASTLYQRGLAVLKDLDEGILHFYALIGQADLRRLEGELDEAEAIASRAKLEAEEHENPQEIGMALATLGAIFRDQGKYPQATSALEEAHGLLTSATSRVEAVRTKLMLASTLFAARRRSLALAALSEVAHEAEEIGHDAFLRPLLRRELPLLRYALARGYGEPISRWARLATATKPSDGATVEGPPQVKVQALGHFLVTVNSSQVSDVAWETSKAREMFLYLLVRGQSATKEETVEALWPSLPASKANSYFHASLFRLRRVLGANSVAKQDAGYALVDAARFEVDFVRFLAGADLLNSQSAATLRKAVSVYEGPFAPDIYSDWACEFRAKLEERYLSALDALLHLLAEDGERAEVAWVCQKILDVDPFHELAWKELIQYYRDRGLLGLTLRLYRQCADAYRRELGMEVPYSVASLMRSA